MSEKTKTNVGTGFIMVLVLSFSLIGAWVIGDNRGHAAAGQTLQDVSRRVQDNANSIKTCTDDLAKIAAQLKTNSSDVLNEIRTEVLPRLKHLEESRELPK